MPTYKVNFRGRTLGAIGVFYPIIMTVEAETPEAALLKIYDTHERDGTPALVKEVK